MTASYSVVIRRSAEKELRGVPKADLERIMAKIRALGTDPRRHGCEKLVSDDHFRLRQPSFGVPRNSEASVLGRPGIWRAVYAVDDAGKTVTVLKIGNRRKEFQRPLKL